MLHVPSRHQPRRSLRLVITNPPKQEGLFFFGAPTDANGVRLVGRAEAMGAFFLSPADLESVGRGGSTTITFVAKQLNHGLSLPTKRSGIDRRNLLAERDGYPCALNFSIVFEKNIKIFINFLVYLKKM